VAQAQYLGYGMAPYAGGWLLTADRPDDPLYLAAGVRMAAADVSRDGRWVCFGLHASRMKVFDGRTGRPVWEDSHDRMGQGGRFTPDGRWLVANHRACRGGDWRTTVVLDPSHTGGLWDVSPDSRLALFGMSEGYARLVEIATGRELVRLEPPDGSLGQMTFSRDSTRLLEPCGAGLRVWDLRRIRRQLAEYGLDWAGPAYPSPADGPSRLPAPLQLTTVPPDDLLSDPARLREYERKLTSDRLAADRNDAQGNLEQACWLMRENRHAEALPHLQRAQQRRPASYAVRMNKGLCLMRLDRVQEAIPEFTAADRARPEDYRPKYQRAQAHKRLGRHAEAARDLTDVLKRVPGHVEYYEERAVCYAALGDQVKAASDRAAYARLLPRSARGLNGRAWQLVMGPTEERDPKRGLELIRKAVKVEPNESMYQNTLGVALYRNGLWTEAVAALKRSLELGQGSHDGSDLFFLAMCHVRLDEKRKAKDCFERAVKWVEDPKNLANADDELKAVRTEAEQALRALTP
jgi:tetratricopeptide (TPR) repeat protein